MPNLKENLLNKLSLIKYKKKSLLLKKKLLNQKIKLKKKKKKKIWQTSNTKNIENNSNKEED